MVWFARHRWLLRLHGGALALVLLLIARPAHAEKWGHPAAGGSTGDGPEVVLTFDDGPHERFTPMILDTLAQRRIHAVFFWVGHRVTRPSKFRDRRLALVQRAVKEGHLIGNHTINHVHLCRVAAAEAADEIDNNARIYAELTGLPMTLFRAPYGDHCERLIDMLAARDLDHLHWDIDPREYLHHDSAQTAASVIAKIRSIPDTGRAVVLMHDTKLASARALPRVLDWIDAENIRREQRGRPTIRIVSGAELAAERMDLAAREWAMESVAHAAKSLAWAVGRVIPGSKPGVLSRR